MMIIEKTLKLTTNTIFIFFILCAFTFAADSVTTRKEEEYKAVEKLLVLNGTREQLKQIPAMLQDQLLAQKDKLKEETYTKISNIFKEAYKDEILYKGVADVVAANYDKKRFKAVLKWLQSPIGEKMTRLEIEATTPEAMNEFNTYAHGLKIDEISDKRVALVKRFNEVSRITEMGMFFLESAIIETTKAMNLALPPEKQVGEKQLEEMRNDFRTRMEPTVRNYTFIATLFTYRSVKDKELNKYIAFYESGNGKWYSVIMAQALLEALKKPMGEIYPRIQELSRGKTTDL